MKVQKKLLVFISAAAVVLVLAFLGYFWLRKSPERESIFDRIVSIPKELVLDIPNLPPLCDELPGLKKGFIDIPGGKIYYEEEGQGVPLVLINGGPGGTHHVFHPYFSQLKDVARLIYYDQRGTGKSLKDDTGKTYTIKQAVEDLESLRKALGIDKWVVLGWSYGGLLAQCYALTYPEHVQGLVLVAAGDGLRKVTMKPGRGSMFISQAEREAIKKVWKAYNDHAINLVQMGYNKELCGDWKRQGYYKPTPEEAVRATRYEWSPAPGFRELICPDEGRIGLDGKFDDFEVPTLIYEATWDLTWDTDKAGYIRKNHPHAQVEIFEKSGHAIFADEPEKFFDLLRNFLHKAEITKITYKPGNRIEWPVPVSDLVRKLALAGSVPQKADQEKLFLACYDEALKDNVIDDRAWNEIALHFMESKRDPDKCLTALQHLEVSNKKLDPATWQTFGYCVKTWQGHMLDLLGRRAEALECYREALKTNNGRSDNWFGGFRQIDKKWLEERLKTPFKWD